MKDELSSDILKLENITVYFEFTPKFWSNDNIHFRTDGNFISNDKRGGCTYT